MELTSIDTICLALIILIGLPHGAIDGPLLNKVNSMRINHNLQLLLYVFAGIGFWIFWAYFPNIGLSIFLIISLVHFGLGDLRSNFPDFNLNNFEKLIIGFSHGGLVTIITPIFHPEKTFFIFSILGGSDYFFYSFFSAAFLLWCISLLMFSVVAFRCSLKRFPLYEIILLTISCFLLDPIIFFTFYFCGIHTIRHLNSIKAICLSSNEFHDIIYKTIPFFIATMIIVASLVVYYSFYKDFEFNDSLTRTVFILLASLTVPHMIFIDNIFHRRRF